MVRLKSFWPKAVSVLSALVLWQTVAMLVNEPIFLVTPIAVASRFFGLFGEGGFYTALCFSFLRIALGFLAGIFCGITLGGAAGRFAWLEHLLFPYMVTVRSVPVASFAVVALLWFSASTISSFVAFLIVLPIVYHAVLEGTKNTDPKLREMATVFRLSPLVRLRYIWLPSVRPFLLSAMRVSIGLAWKSGIAAELIGVPHGSLGEVLYLSKIYSDTAELFAVTAVIILSCVLCEKAVMAAVTRLLGEKRRTA